MKRKNETKFNLASVKIEDGVPMNPRSLDTTPIYELLLKMNVGQSIKLPKEVQRQAINAKVAIKRHLGRTFIYRNLDKYNFRMWRIEDNTKLRTILNKRK